MTELIFSVTPENMQAAFSFMLEKYPALLLEEKSRGDNFRYEDMKQHQKRFCGRIFEIREHAPRCYFVREIVC